MERREANRERKAEAAARIEKSIEKELIDRLKSKAYGDAPLNVNEEIWQKILDEELEDAEEDESDEDDENAPEEEDEDDDEVSYYYLFKTIYILIIICFRISNLCLILKMNLILKILRINSNGKKKRSKTMLHWQTRKKNSSYKYFVQTTHPPSLFFLSCYFTLSFLFLFSLLPPFPSFTFKKIYTIIKRCY